MLIVRTHLWSVLLFLKNRDILSSHKSRSDMLFAIIMMLSWLKAKMWTGLDLRCMCLTLRFFKSWHQNLPQNFVNLSISRNYVEKTTQPKPSIEKSLVPTRRLYFDWQVKILISIFYLCRSAQHRSCIEYCVAIWRTKLVLASCS